MLLRLLEPCLARNGSAQIFDLYIYIYINVFLEEDTL